MENKYTNYWELSTEDEQLYSSFLENSKTKISVKWLRYLLISTAIVLWIVFNILAIENYQFSLYPLVVMNLILYFVIAITINSDSNSGGNQASLPRTDSLNKRI